MFETAELGRTISRKDFRKSSDAMRQDLLELQDELRKSRKFQVILVFAGVDGGGKGETVSLLNEWMDPRWLITRAYDEATDDESQRPEFWRYWRDLPPRGRIGMFLSAWYSRPVVEYAHGIMDEATFLNEMTRIVRFERALARDGAEIQKFWMHLSHGAQEERLKNLERDPLTKARVTARDWENWRLYDRFIDTAEHVITRTNRGIAPWTVIEGADANYRSITVASILRDALERRLDKAHDGLLPGACAAAQQDGKNKKNGKDKSAASNKKSNGAGFNAATSITILSQLDMTKRLDKGDYASRLVEQQAELHRLHLKAKAEKISSILVFEGPDAAGKGGAIRRINEGLDARNLQVHGIAAPSDEEKAQHYLWRFWRRLPCAGLVTVFDRSWYGRVLVERINGFATDDEWRRSYAEINDFEEQLIDHGIVLIKYWIHISKSEQLARFKAREKTPYKRWKLTDEDWRNRNQWDDYEQAVNDMVQYTSTSVAPWTLIEGNDKRFARLKVVQTFCERLATAVGDGGV